MAKINQEDLIFKDIFGKVGEGLHSYRIFNIAIIDVLFTILGAFIAKFLGLNPGNALLFVVLCASASYLAVPAAMRMTVPEAKSSYYISTTLGLTFPFNIVMGIPVYMSLVNKIIPNIG